MWILFIVSWTIHPIAYLMPQISATADGVVISATTAEPAVVQTDRAMPRLFLALVPPATALDALTGLDREPTPGVRWTDPTTWHVTLRFLGDCDATDVVDALDAVPLPRVTARLGPTVTLLGPRVLVVPVAGVEPLHHAVVAATRAVGRPPDERPYRAHLTLARLAQDTRPALLGHRIDGSFVGDVVHLQASTLEQGVTTHERVHAWSTTR